MPSGCSPWLGRCSAEMPAAGADVRARSDDDLRDRDPLGTMGLARAAGWSASSRSAARWGRLGCRRRRRRVDGGRQRHAVGVVLRAVVRAVDCRLRSTSRSCRSGVDAPLMILNVSVGERREARRSIASVPPSVARPADGEPVERCHRRGASDLLRERAARALRVVAGDREQPRRGAGRDRAAGVRHRPPNVPVPLSVPPCRNTVPSSSLDLTSVRPPVCASAPSR